MRKQSRRLASRLHREADQRLCFRCLDRTFPLFQASGHLLVCVRPGQNPHCWFSHVKAHMYFKTLSFSIAGCVSVPTSLSVSVPTSLTWQLMTTCPHVQSSDLVHLKHFKRTDLKNNNYLVHARIQKLFLKGGDQLPIRGRSPPPQKKQNKNKTKPLLKPIFWKIEGGGVTGPPIPPLDPPMWLYDVAQIWIIA